VAISSLIKEEAIVAETLQQTNQRAPIIPPPLKRMKHGSQEIEIS
jgi:hypothetical protein